MTTVSETLATLKASLAATGEDPEYEGLVAGRGDIDVQGIATCSAPSVEALQRAAARGSNLVVADGHPFYTYDPDWGADNVPEVVAASPVGRAKQAIIDQHGIAVVRLPTAFAARFPDAAALALARSWDFRGTRAVSPGSAFVVADIAPTAFDSLARSLAQRSDCGGIRLIGRADLVVRRVAVGTGLLSPAALARMLEDPGVDAVVGGEVVEWEGGPYFEDVIGAGRDAGLILTGFAASREPVAGALADWVRQAVPGVPVVEVAESDPVWTATNGGTA